VVTKDRDGAADAGGRLGTAPEDAAENRDRAEERAGATTGAAATGGAGAATGATGVGVDHELVGHVDLLGVAAAPGAGREPASPLDGRMPAPPLDCAP